MVEGAIATKLTQNTVAELVLAYWTAKPPGMKASKT